MGGDPMPPAYPGNFLWLSVNKIQLFSPLQMQLPSVCLCNNHTHSLGPDIPREEKGEVNTLTSESSYQTNILPTTPHPGLIPPSCLSLEKQA